MFQQLHSTQDGFLSLDSNKISNIQTNTIKGLFNDLSLENNNLNSSSFHTNAFGHLPNLKEISFSKNLIRKLNFNHSFQFNLTHLEGLNFKFNKIDYIDSLSFFSKFPNLIWLDLSFNNFFSLTNSYLYKQNTHKPGISSPLISNQPAKRELKTRFIAGLYRAHAPGTIVQNHQLGWGGVGWVGLV